MKGRTIKLISKILGMVFLLCLTFVAINVTIRSSLIGFSDGSLIWIILIWILFVGALKRYFKAWKV